SDSPISETVASASCEPGSIVWKVAFIEPADCSPSMIPPSGRPPLRQKSRNFVGAVKADAVRARISQAVAGMSELWEIGREKGLSGGPVEPKSTDQHPIHQRAQAPTNTVQKALVR